MKRFSIPFGVSIVITLLLYLLSTGAYLWVIIVILAVVIIPLLVLIGSRRRSTRPDSSAGYFYLSTEPNLSSFRLQILERSLLSLPVRILKKEGVVFIPNREALQTISLIKELNTIYRHIPEVRLDSLPGTYIGHFFTPRDRKKGEIRLKMLAIPFKRASRRDLLLSLSSDHTAEELREIVGLASVRSTL